MRLLILLTVIAVVLVGLAEAKVFSNSLSLDAVGMKIIIFLF